MDAKEPDEQTRGLLDLLKSVYKYLKELIEKKKMRSNFEAYLNWIMEKIDLELHSQKSEVKQMKIKKWDMYWAEFGYNIGSEYSNKRPVLILQNDVGNTFGTTTIVAPITSRKPGQKLYPCDALLNHPDLSGPSIVRLSHITTISKARLDGKIGEINEVDYRKKIDKRAMVSLDIR